MITEANLVFNGGKAILKRGRKIIATVFDKELFYPLHNIKSGWSQRFNLQIGHLSRECSTKEEVVEFINKYC